MSIQEISSVVNCSSPRKVVLDMVMGYIKPQLIYVAAKLGIADLLVTGPKPFEEIASQVEAEPTALRRLLQGLVNIEILAEEVFGMYGLTSLGECLTSDGPDSLREIAILQGEEAFQAWGNLLYSVQTGKPAFEQVFGAQFFEYLAQNPSSQQRFDAFMSSTSHLAARAFEQAYDFSHHKQVIDVGGGSGLLLATILKANTHLHGLLFDRTATTTSQAGECFATYEVAARCQIGQGDFFERVPPNADVYILSQIIHDWDDERARIILLNCRRAMPPQSRLLLYELVMPVAVKMTNRVVERDLVMLVLTGGRERTADEFCKLLASAGFELCSIRPTRHNRCIIEAAPIPFKVDD